MFLVLFGSYSAWRSNFSKIQLVRDGRTNGQTGGWMDGRDGRVEKNNEVRDLERIFSNPYDLH